MPHPTLAVTPYHSPRINIRKLYAMGLKLRTQMYQATGTPPTELIIFYLRVSCIAEHMQILPKFIMLVFPCLPSLLPGSPCLLNYISRIKITNIKQYELL